ncbi:MAG: sigma 54-interacting transcriptional regulator [Planctomycetota bacterium]
MAKVVHTESRRAAGPLRVLDVSSLPENLAEVELFGATAGAYTDALNHRPGLIPAASGGTLVVDRAESMSPALQAKLARVLSEGRVRPIGAEVPISVDVRFIFVASCRKDRLQDENLRRDFVDHIGGLKIVVPPLRERIEDFPELVSLFLREEQGPAPDVDEDGMIALRAHSWPGNVRELRNVLARLHVEHPGGISGADVRSILVPNKSIESTRIPDEVIFEHSLRDLQRLVEREFIVRNYRRLGGDTEALCRLLELSRRQLYRRCVRLGIRLRDERRRGVLE